MITCNLKINTLVKQSQCSTKTYTARTFLAVMSSGYKAWLGEKERDENFFTIEPQNCKLIKLFLNQSEDLSSSYFEQLVAEVLHDLLIFGRAYMLINPKYITITNEDGIENKELNSLDMGAVSGVVKRQNNQVFEFCALSKFDNALHCTTVPKDQLVIFDLKDLGYRRNFFYRLINILNKFDSTSIPADLNLCRGYNFTEHYKYIKLQELKQLKTVGWVDNSNDLLDSYRLYNQIRMNKIRVGLLKYVVMKINEGLKRYLNETDDGELVLHARSVDYDRCWLDYSSGKISHDQLRELLY